MGVLPVPGEIFWNDFSFDLRDFTVFRNEKQIATYKGLSNKGSIFLKPDVDVQCGDVLSFEDTQITVQRIENETYNGNVDLISVHY